MPRAATLERPRTASREVRRRQLIEATIECIAENGLTGTTMAEVTRRANLSMGLVTFHFRSKENLLQATLVHLAEEHRNRWVESLADSALGPAAKLAGVIDAHFHPTTCTHTRIAAWFAFFGEAPHREVYRARIAHFDAERAETVIRLCRAVAKGDGAAVRAEHVARNLESLADGLLLTLLLHPGRLDHRRAREQVHSYLRSVFPHAFATWPGEAEGPPLRRGAVVPAGSGIGAGVGA